MAQQIGLIRKIQDDGFALVVTDRQGACGGCHGSSGGCRSCLTGAKLESRVINPINAQEGDLVKINLDSWELFKGALILYVLPMACLLIAALTGAWVAKQVSWNETAGSVIGALVGLTLGIGAVMRMDRSRYVRRHMTPAITAVVTPSASAHRSWSRPSCCR